MASGRIRRNIFAAAAGLFFWSGQALAQENISLDKYKALYPNEQMIQLELSEQMNIAIGSRGLDITTKHNSKVLYLTDRAQEYAEKYIYDDSFMVVTDVEAYTLHPGSKGYKRADKAKIEEKRSVDDDHFYDDRREKKITYLGLKAGSISDLSYTELTRDEHFLGGFFFQKFVPLEKGRFEVTFPQNVKLRYKVFGDSSLVRFDSRQEGKNIVYTWEAKNVPKLEYEGDAPSFRIYMPHVMLYIEEYELKKEKVKVFSDVSGLYAWYTSLLQGIELKPDANIIRITDSIIAGAESDYEKTKRIFYWVQDHIHYVAIENGLGGFIPRQAAAVCTKRYGDCKDMANLMVVMLRHAKIPAYHVWIGTRDIPYSYSDIPTGVTDNHMITLAEIDGKKFFLDATGGYIPLGFPTPSIQEKEGLVGRGKDKFEVLKVPTVPRELNGIYDTTHIRIEGDELKGSATTVYSGFSKYNLTGSLAYYGREDQRKRFEGILERGNNKCHFDEITWSGLLNRDSSLVTKYSFSVPQYVLKNEGELYVNMYLDKPMKGALIDTALKKLDREIEYKYQYVTRSVLEIPAGYKNDNLPPNASFKNKDFGFEVKYRKEGNTIVLDQHLYTEMLTLYRKDFPEWNRMVKALQEAYRQAVVLKKI